MYANISFEISEFFFNQSNLMVIRISFFFYSFQVLNPRCGLYTGWWAPFIEHAQFHTDHQNFSTLTLTETYQVGWEFFLS